MKRVVYLTNIASPYRVRFFDELSKYCDMTVLYYDRNHEQKDRDADWFTEGSGAHKRVQLKRRVATIAGESLCLDVISWLKKQFDVVVIHGYSSTTAMLAMLWLKLHKIPFYLEVDGGLIREESEKKYRFKKLLVSSADRWLSSGKATTDYLVHYGAVRERTDTYPFTSLEESDILSEPVSFEEKQELRSKLGMAEEKIALYVGRFDPLKGMDDLLHIVPKLEKTIGVYFVGGEPTEEHLAFCNENNAHNAHFLGFHKKEALTDYYKAADFLVLPTKSDVWGLVINEAMACGLPVITTDKCVAGLELVEEGVNGAIVPAEDSECLARKMNELIHMDLNAMGEASLAKIRPYTVENMARGHARIFEDRS